MQRKPRSILDKLQHMRKVELIAIIVYLANSLAYHEATDIAEVVQEAMDMTEGDALNYVRR
jgi:hypothetical protein